MANRNQYAPYLPVEMTDAGDRDQIIRYYFDLGFTYPEILAFLALYHELKIGIRQLHRILRSMGLRRNAVQPNYNRVIDSIQVELSGSGRDLGYRSMQTRLRLSHGINIDRESVRMILRVLDPDGVSSRRQRRLRRRQYTTKGPNYLHHVDGWDKLKRYGLCVHGCIDGFSRRLMWLEGSSTNNDPFVVCQYYVRSALQVNGVPTVVRADRGTENVNMELIQTLLRNEHGDVRGLLNSTFLYGRSTSNQRIESWWSKFPLFGMQSWKDHFKELEDFGIIDVSSEMDIQCIRFCYLNLLRGELELIRTQWNTHTIRPNSTNESSPSGKPDIIYHFPEIYNSMSYLKPLDRESLDILAPVLTRQVDDCGPIYKDIFQSIVEEHHLPIPSTLHEAANNLVHILDTVEDENG